MAGTAFVSAYLVLIQQWEQWRTEFVQDVFGRVAFMTRYGRLGYEEAMGIPPWERRRFIEALDRILREEQEKTGLPSTVTDDD